MGALYSSYDEKQARNFQQYGNPNYKPLVIIPGLDGATSFFQDVIPELTVDWNVIVFHIPLRPSFVDPKSYTFEYIALALRDLLDELKVDKVSIVGESFGGVIAQHFAFISPERVKSLVLLSSLAKTNLPPEIEWKVKYLLPIVCTLGYFFPATAQSLFAKLHVDDVCEPSEPKFVRDLFVQEASKAHFYSVMTRIQIVYKLDIVEKTKTITAPSLIVYGADDHFTKQSSQELHGLIKNSVIKSLPGGHLPHITSPKEFSVMITEFVKSVLSDAFPGAKRAIERLMVDLPTAKAMFPILDNYINRPSIEERILQWYMSSKKTDEYVVIVGPKGSGKTYAVARVLGDMPGVLHFDISGVDTERTILRRLLQTSGEPVEEDVDLSLTLLQTILNSAIGHDGRRITIVFEVERGGPSGASEGVLHTVKSAAKKLAAAANVMVVLSEANSGLMGEDLRHKYIWVDGMTNEEAAEYAKKVYPAVTDRDLNLFFDKVGTLPLVVRDFAESLKSGMTAADYVDKTVDVAQSDLDGFAHQAIIKAIKSSPDGVCSKRFKDMYDKNVCLAQPKQVAAAMKESNAIVYHQPSGEYRLTSRAHRTAMLSTNESCLGSLSVWLVRQLLL